MKEIIKSALTAEIVDNGHEWLIVVDNKVIGGVSKQLCYELEEKRIASRQEIIESILWRWTQIEMRKRRKKC